MTLKDLLDISLDTLFNLYDENEDYITGDWHDKANRTYPEEFRRYLNTEVISARVDVMYDEENISDENPDGHFAGMDVVLKGV